MVGWLSIHLPLCLSSCPRVFHADGLIYLQAEREAEEEAAAARAAANSPARPPTALLGFAPASQASETTQSGTGKHSWPTTFFDGPVKKHRAHSVVFNSGEQGSEASGAHDLNRVDSGTVSSVAKADKEGGSDGEEAGQDYGAAWREAAQSSPAQPMPSPQDTGAPCCAS